MPSGLPAPRLRILLAEDHPGNRALIGLLLDRIGVEVVFALNGAEAVEARQSGACDLILMDMRMPQIDGVAAVRAIRRFEAEAGAPRVPIAMLSGDVGERHRQAAFEAGADHYIEKPVTGALLAQGIETALAAVKAA
jgi:two-component system, sensor histidine kinase